MTRTAAQALTAALNRIGQHGYGGLCLKFTRECYNIPARYASAADAWKYAKHKHPVTAKTLGNTPAGAPLHLAAKWSKYGHVAIWDGAGKIITTDSSTNRIMHQSVKSWLDYGWKLLGWTADLNGQRIQGLGEQAMTSKADYFTPDFKLRIAYPNDRGAHVTQLQALLNAHYPARALVVDGINGAATQTLIKHLQKNYGLTVDGIAGRDTWAAALKQ